MLFDKIWFIHHSKFLFLPKGGTFTTTAGLYPGNNSLTNSTGFNSTQQVAVHFLQLHVCDLIPGGRYEFIQVGMADFFPSWKSL